MDELKKHIQQNAEKLNIDEPSMLVWKKVREEVNNINKVKAVKIDGVFRRWAVAACVFGLAGMGVWYVWDKKKPVQQTAAVHTAPKTAIPASEKTESAQEEKPEALITARTHPKPKANKPINQPPTALNSMELGELHELEYSFSQVINLQQARISTIPMYAETPDYFKDFKIQLKQIDKDEKTIKSDISHNGMNGELLDQLINLYQQKLSVLKQLQLEMNKTNNRFKQNREPVDSTKSYFIKL